MCSVLSCLQNLLHPNLPKLFARLCLWTLWKPSRSGDLQGAGEATVYAVCGMQSFARFGKHRFGPWSHGRIFAREVPKHKKSHVPTIHLCMDLKSRAEARGPKVVGPTVTVYYKQTSAVEVVSQVRRIAAKSSAMQEQQGVWMPPALGVAVKVLHPKQPEPYQNLLRLAFSLGHVEGKTRTYTCPE